MTRVPSLRRLRAPSVTTDDRTKRTSGSKTSFNATAWSASVLRIRPIHQSVPMRSGAIWLAEKMLVRPSGAISDTRGAPSAAPNVLGFWVKTSNRRHPTRPSLEFFDFCRNSSAWRLSSRCRMKNVTCPLCFKVSPHESKVLFLKCAG